jgi:hypothetical protein
MARGRNRALVPALPLPHTTDDATTLPAAAYEARYEEEDYEEFIDDRNAQKRRLRASASSVHSSYSSSSIITPHSGAAISLVSAVR